MRRKVAVALTILALASELSAAGPKVIERQMTLSWSGDRPVLSASFEEVFDQELRKRLSSGFASRILVEVWLKERQRNVPLAQGLFQVMARYEIWEEVFIVELLGPEGPQRLLLNDLQTLVRKCGSFRELKLKPLVEIYGNLEVEVEMRVTVNPAVPGLREKVRQYLANPEGGRRLSSPRSFFGSFSRIFVSERDVQADSIFIFRSPPMRLEVAAKK